MQAIQGALQWIAVGAVARRSGAGELLRLDYALNLLEAHRRGDADHSREIWTVLIFCIWHAIFVEHSLDPGISRNQSAASLSVGRVGDISDVFATSSCMGCHYTAPMIAESYPRRDSQNKLTQVHLFGGPRSADYLFMLSRRAQ